MLVPILFVSGIFIVCFFLTVVPKRPFVLTKTIEFSSLYDLEAHPYEPDSRLK